MYKLKLGDARNRPRYKAKIVVKGFQQKKGVDFDEIFSLVVKMTSIRTVLSIAASMNLEVEELDVKTAFRLNLINKSTCVITRELVSLNSSVAN